MKYNPNDPTHRTKLLDHYAANLEKIRQFIHQFTQEFESDFVFEGTIIADEVPWNPLIDLYKTAKEINLP